MFVAKQAKLHDTRLGQNVPIGGGDLLPALDGTARQPPSAEGGSTMVATSTSSGRTLGRVVLPAMQAHVGAHGTSREGDWSVVWEGLLLMQATSYTISFWNDVLSRGGRAKRAPGCLAAACRQADFVDFVSVSWAVEHWKLLPRVVVWLCRSHAPIHRGSGIYRCFENGPRRLGVAQK